jgi:hypothetical protein
MIDLLTHQTKATTQLLAHFTAFKKKRDEQHASDEFRMYSAASCRHLPLPHRLSAMFAVWSVKKHSFY